MNQQQKEIKHTVLSFTKLGLYITSFLSALVGIGLTYNGEYLFGGILMAQFVIWIFFSRSLFNKLEESK